MRCSSSFLGAFRTQSHLARPPPLNPLYTRLSNISPLPSLLVCRTPVSHRFQPPSRVRPFSLSSLIFPKKAAPTPTPQVVASIATIEADANANPHDLGKQLALYDALAATKVRPAYDVIIARWERMCEFDPASPLLRSDVAFKHYINALVANGLEHSVNAAVRRRDSLLAASAATTASSLDEGTPVSQLDTDATSLAARPGVATVTPPSTTPTSSQQVANAVLSGQAPQATTLNLDMAKLAMALNNGVGVPGNPIAVTISEPKHSWVPGVIKFVVLTAMGGFLILVVLAVLLENSGLMKAGPRQAEFEPVQDKTYRFSDVHGVDEAKNELQEVVEFLRNPSSFATLGGKLPKGVLLTGPPGTGKTMLARAVAGEAGVPFLFASGAEFDEMFVGVGAKRVRDLFAAARKKQPAIIFIDELDAIGGKRSSRDQHYMKQTLNQLLVEMDGFLQTEGVIVIAATNFPDSLDPALVRPGRFDRHIEVPLPDVRGRTQILQHHMKGVITEPGVDPMIIARGTAGFSGADLQNMVNQAAVQASRQGCKAVGMQHFEWAKDRIVMGSERKSSFISDKVKRMTAYHEGGHALVALYTEGAMPLHKVTCIPRGRALGVTSQLPEDDMYSVSLKEYLAIIDVCLGGRAAEELIYGPENVTSGASSDLMRATRTAQSMVKNWGYSNKIGPVYYNDRDETISPKKRDEIESEVRALLVAGETRVARLLKEKEQELHRLAAALVEHETLDAEEVQKVIKGEPIRDIKEVLETDLARMPAES